jgi:alpha-galactosidase
MKRNYKNKDADKWYSEIVKKPEKLPFSFIYGGTEYNGFSADNFSLKDKTVNRVGDKEEADFYYELNQEIDVCLKLTHYFSHGVTEWTVFFENNTDRNSAIFEDIKTKMNFGGDAPVLKGILGDYENYYEPYCKDLKKESVSFCSDIGRATHIYFPYFNLEYGSGGAMLAIGWAGTWSASFSATENGAEYVAQAVNGLKTYLKPGEKIRTALFVFAPYSVRDEYYATNFWRSWFNEYNLPKASSKGDDLTPFSTSCLAVDTGLPNSDGSISENYKTWKPSLQKMIEEGIKIDFRWLDAGWYIAPDGTSAESFVEGHDWWDTIGTWELDPIKWPGKSLLESTEFARKNGMKTLMWFEPERVTDPENLSKNYGYDADWAIRREGDRAVANNIGDPNCLAWTSERICRVLRENKVEMYREDNNSDSASLWKHMDALEGENRKGITEMKIIAAHYELWDRIIECTLGFGGCGFVDSCASGGGRNDIESLRRGIPLLRSDADRTTTALRLSMSHSFNKWITFSGSSSHESDYELNAPTFRDSYILRASYLPVLNVNAKYATEPDYDFETIKKGIEEWKKTHPFLLKEFYTLTPWRHRTDKTGFTAFVYFDPEIEEGLLFAFRQEECKEEKLTVKIPSLMGENLEFTDKDSGERFYMDEENTLELVFDKPREAKMICVKGQ